MKRKSCEGCKYYRDITGAGIKLMGCHYCFDTGEPRGCPAHRCNKKVIGTYKKYSMFSL